MPQEQTKDDEYGGQMDPLRGGQQFIEDAHLVQQLDSSSIGYKRLIGTAVVVDAHDIYSRMVSLISLQRSTHNYYYNFSIDFNLLSEFIPGFR